MSWPTDCTACEMSPKKLPTPADGVVCDLSVARWVWKDVPVFTECCARSVTICCLMSSRTCPGVLPVLPAARAIALYRSRSVGEDDMGSDSTATDHVAKVHVCEPVSQALDAVNRVVRQHA